MKNARPRKRATRDLVEIDKASGAGRFFHKMKRDVIHDLGGVRALSRVEHELLEAFCGAATAVRYMNTQLLLGDVVEIDFASYAQLASTMLRLGVRLGLRRRLDVSTPADPLDYATRYDADHHNAEQVQQAEQTQ